MDLHNNDVGRDSAGQPIDTSKLQAAPGSGPVTPYQSGPGSSYPY